MSNDKGTTTQKLKILTEIAVLAAMNIAKKPIRALTETGLTLVHKLRQIGLLEVKERPDGTVGSHISTQRVKMDKDSSSDDQKAGERLQYDFIVLEKCRLLNWYQSALTAAEGLSKKDYFSLSANDKKQVGILEELGLLEPRKVDPDGKPQAHVGKLVKQPQMELFT